MDKDLETAGNWAKELGVAEKKLKEALKAAGIRPDATKGACGDYTKASANEGAGRPRSRVTRGARHLGRLAHRREVAGRFREVLTTASRCGWRRAA